MSAIAGTLVIGSVVLATLAIVALTCAGFAHSWRAWRLQRDTQPCWLVVAEREDLTPDAFTVRLAPTRWGRLSDAQPGQHIVLHVPLAETPATRRAYSLADWEPAPRTYQLGIKREAEGAASRWLHEHAKPGLRLLASRPKGPFHAGKAEGATVAILIAGGIGITPMRAMLHAWTASARRPGRVILHFSARTADQLYFHDELAAMARAHTWFTYVPRLTKPDPAWTLATGRLSVREVLEQIEPHDRPAILLCANRAMEDALVAGLIDAGIDRDAVHRESFGITAEANEIKARIAYRGRQFDYAGAPTLLHALLAQGFDIPSECRAGECGACRLAIARGTARNLLTGTEETASTLTCCAVPIGDLELAG